MTDLDSVSLEILRTQLESIAEEMGQVLIRSARSPNITERKDCSAALFDADGRLIAQAEHIPVHLGAMPAAVEAITEHDPKPGEAYLINDPFAGGTHLPDITVVKPIAPGGTILGYGVVRAHHADVGGMTPGSMPAGATEIYQEGLRIPGVRLVEGGEIDKNVLSLLLANVRNPEQRRADLRAQLAGADRAETRLGDLVDEHGHSRVLAAFDAVIEYSRRRVESELAAFPDGTYRARDALEGDGVTEEDIPIVATITVSDEELCVDFAGTAEQVEGNLNAPRSVAKSAVYFVVRAVTDPEIPPNAGCYEPVTVRTPEGSLLNPAPPAAVVGGNVETSQRVTDVVMTAIGNAVPERVPAQGQGTMNNLVIGSRDAEGFSYYETIGGGAGAGADQDGMDGVHVGMTNTLNTPVEALEAEYPLLVERYALRPDSGGDGRHRGGLGLIRELTVETDAVVSFLTERRRHAPGGIAGGRAGATGRNLLDGDAVGAKTTREVPAGTTVAVHTPGGGGYGDPAERDATAREADREDGKVTDESDGETRSSSK